MEKKISFGCFSNLGYDEVGKLSQAKIQTKFFTNDIALFRVHIHSSGKLVAVS